MKNITFNLMRSCGEGIAFVTLLLLAVSASLPVASAGGPEDASNEYGSCGECYCIPDESAECPSTIPQTDFTDAIPVLQQFEWTNPYSLDCNPYVKDEECNTQPLLEKGGACYFDIKQTSNKQCPESFSYETKTFSGTLEEAQAKGLLVTHEGACGTCSSMQDLATYMKHGADLASQSRQCSMLGVMWGQQAAVLCYENLGFTNACAKTWYYNGSNTNQYCRDACIEYAIKGLPNNGPPPSCPMQECLQCDEDHSGPMFALFAGRTRRNSGLLSSIARPCSSIVNITQVDPCSSFDDEDYSYDDHNSKSGRNLRRNRGMD